MPTFSQSIKGLNTAIESTDIKAVEKAAANVKTLAIQDKVKFLCEHKEEINKALDLAKIFTGAKGDKILDTVKTVIASLC